MGQEKHFLCTITPLFQGDGKISKHPLPGFWVLVLHENKGWGEGGGGVTKVASGLLIFPKVSPQEG